MIKSRFTYFKLFLIYFIAIIFLYYPVINTYFSQDDFFHFTVSQTDGSISGFVNLLGFHPFEDRKIAFYRPIFREVIYNLYYQVFSLNSFPFRAFQLVIHFINVFLVFSLIKSIYKNQRLAFFVSFFFGVSAANVGILYYLAGGIQASGATLFILISVLYFWKYLTLKHRRFKLVSFVFFFLALASHELAISTPFIFSLLIIKYNNTLKLRTIENIFKELSPLLLVILPYLYLEIFRIGFSHQETQYKVVFSIQKSLNSLAWYIGWAIGIPEMLVDFVLPGLKIKTDIFKYWGAFYVIIFSCFLGAIWIISLNIFYLLFNKNFKKLFVLGVFVILAFVIFLLPVLLLPLHRSTYYLAPALPIFWFGIGLVVITNYYQFAKVNQNHAQKIFILTFFVLFILSMTSAKLGETTHWAASRGKISQKIITEVKQSYPELPKGATIYFKNDPNYPFVARDWGGSSKQAYFALNNQDGLRLLYEDPTLSVIYEDINKSKSLDYLKNFYEITAKVN